MKTENSAQPEIQPTGCCPPFEPTPWEDKVHEWKNKHFVRDRVITAFYMPLNFGQVMKRLMKKVEGAGAQTPDYLCLSNHTSKWNMDLFLAVDKEIPGVQNETFDGKFYTRVYEGDYRHTGEWCTDFEQKSAERDLKIDKQYMWYTTCPKCAKKYGKNYVVVAGKIG